MADIELDRITERLKRVSEETKNMSDAFSGLTSMSDVSSDSLNSMKVMLKQFQNSVSTNTVAMGVASAQTKSFNQQSTNAASLLNALTGEIKDHGTATAGTLNQFQSAMNTVQNSATGLMSGMSGSNDQDRSEYLKKLESHYSGSGMMQKGFEKLGGAVNSILPELGQGWDIIKDSIIFQTAQQAMGGYVKRFLHFRKERKLQKKRERFLATGGAVANATYDLRDKMLKGLSTFMGEGSFIGDFAADIRTVRNEGLGIKDWEKLGARETDNEQAKLLREFTEKQQETSDAEINKLQEELSPVTESLRELKQVADEEMEAGEFSDMNSTLELMEDEQKEANRINAEILKLENERLDMDTTEGVENALETLNATTRETDDHQEILFGDLTQVTKEMLSGSPPYLKTIAETLQGHTQLLEQTAEAGAGGGGPIPEGATKDPPMPNFLGFLSALGPAIKAIPGAIVKVLKGIGQGIAGMFMALGSIPAPVLALGLAAITGIALNMVILAKALQIAGPVIVKIMGAIGKILTSVFEGYVKVIEAAGKVIVPILRAMANVIKAIGGVVMKFFKGFATVINAIGSVISGVFKGIIGIFKAIGTVIETIGRVIVTIGRVIIDFIKTLVASLIQLTEVPFWNYIKLAAAFVILGAALGIFGILAGVAVVPLIALGIASIGLAALMATIGDPERLSLLAMGFNTLALAVTKFAISSLALIPALGIFAALSAIPFINKLIGTQEGITKKQEVGTFTAETLVVEGMGGGIAQAMLQQQMTAEGLTQDQGDIMPPGGQIITSNQTNVNNNGTEVHVNKTAVDTNYLETMKGLHQVFA
jgi:hypothetical protein